jgi:hypothetical protein
MGEFLARLADRRRIDQRHVGRRVRHQHGVEQRLVARLQVGQHEVFQQIVVEIGDLGMPARDLQLHGGDPGRQQAFEAIFQPLFGGKGRPLVASGVAEQILAARMIGHGVLLSG